MAGSLGGGRGDSDCLGIFFKGGFNVSRCAKVSLVGLSKGTRDCKRSDWVREVIVKCDVV